MHLNDFCLPPSLWKTSIVTLKTIKWWLVLSFLNVGTCCVFLVLYTLLQIWSLTVGPALFPRHLLFNLITSWKIIILATFKPENAELIILFLGSTFVYLNGVRTSHCDSMSISRSIVGSLPLAFALHYHSNDFLTLLSKVEIYISSCGDK